MALSRDVVIRLLGDADSAVKAQQAAAKAADVSVAAYRRAEREQSKQAKAAETALRQQREAMDSVGRGAMLFGAATAAGLALSAKAAIDWESAWAGVRKTVDGSDAEMAALETELRKLATTLPATHAEIAGVAEAAGQLGIARGDIAEFTKVAIAMGVSTNLSADEAATGMARMSNIMGTAASDVDRMGSALVAVGNAGASTEAEILDMSLRIAAAGRQAGFSEGEVLGLANAMSSLGIQAEAGGTAISTVIKSINNSVMDGGDALSGFAEVAGVTSEQFAAAWRENASSALVLVVQGLARMQAEGKNVNTTIDDLGLGGIRTSDTLLRLAGNADGLADSLALGNQAWAENSALMNEANQRYETTAARLQMARNQITDAAIDIGGLLLPALASGAQMVADFARGFQELPGPLKEAVTILGALAATIGIVGGAALIAVPKVVAFRATMQTLESSTSAAARGMGRFGTFMTGPWGLAIGAASLALGGLVTWLGASSRASEEAAAYQDELAAALRNTNGVIDETVRALAAQKAEEFVVAGRSLLEWAEEAGLDLPVVTDALLGNRDAAEQVDAALASLGQSAEITGQQNMAGLGATMDETASGAIEARGAFGELTGQMGAAVAENERLAAATAETGEVTDAAAGQMDEMAESTESVADQAKALANALDVLNGGTLNLNDAQRDLEQALDDVRERIAGAKAGSDGYSRSLDITTEAGRKNQAALDDVARSAMDVANATFEATGDYGRFRAELEKARRSLFDQARQFFNTEQATWDYVDSVLAVPDEANTTINVRDAAARRAIRDTQALIDGLRGKTVTIQVRAAGRFVINPNGGLQEYGGPVPGRDFWSGGYTGPGGKHDWAGNVHRGEVVWNQDDVAAHGGPSRVDAMRRSRDIGGPANITLLHDTRSLESSMESFANAIENATPAGAAGSGSLGGAWGSIWQYVKARVPQARINSTFRAGDPGYHGRSKAIDFGYGSGPGGLGSAGLARINRVLHDGVGRNLAELIYDGIGDDRPDLKNGRPLTYSRATQLQHRNHVHAAVYRNGTPFVPRDGFAYLHRGERVVNPEQNRRWMTTPTMALTSRGSPAASINVAPPVVRVFLDGQEWRGMARVEAEGVVVDAFSGATSRGRYNG